MGTQGPSKYNQQTTTHSDTDCEILETQDNTAKPIIIPDSPDTSFTMATINQTKDEDKSIDEVLDTTNNDDLEDGEVNESLGDELNLICQVNFKNEQIFLEYRDLVLNSLRKSLNHKNVLLVEGDNTIQVVQNYINVDTSPSVGHKLTSNIKDEPIVEGNKSCSEDEDMGIAGLFMVDTQPAEKVDAVQIPSYKRTIKEVLIDESSNKKKKNDDECLRPKMKKSCFNCDGTDHDLRTCPKPRNNAKINKAKKNMNSRRERYHVDIEQRFAHLRPGLVSNLMREALGIRNGELPFFFYRMRVLGYPPGWLEDARVAHSGIALFDSEGRSVRDPEEEEGQIEADKHKYDINKIISFPGFNTHPGKNFYDDFKHHNVPPMSEGDMKDKFIEMLGDNVAKHYKRKKLKDFPEGDPSEKPSLDSSEMDIDDEINTSNVEFTRPPPPPSPPLDCNEPQPPPPPPDSPNRSLSPTLEDLEEKQKRLRELLQSSVITISDNDDSLIDEVLDLDTSTENSISITSTPSKTSLEDNQSRIKKERSPSPPPVPEQCSQPADPQASHNNTMESVLGTPLLKFSPFDKLPSGENFKVGVSDVINFENLPDSTGTYEKMKDVIKKVRTIVTKLNSEDS